MAISSIAANRGHGKIVFEVGPISGSESSRIPTGSWSSAFAWDFSRLVSPRPTVRVDAADSTGQWTHTYCHTKRLTGHVPTGPWAVHLADDQGLYRLIAFDLDSSRGDPVADAATLESLLAQAGIDTVTCQSGPSGGRHVWMSVVDGLDASWTARLARCVRGLCPSLDITPLLNPATGCVRPPGSPHRAGGVSQVMSGDPGLLIAPVVTAAQLQALIVRFEASAPPRPAKTIDRRLRVDQFGVAWLPGRHTELPPSAQGLLSSTSGDMSQVAWRIICAAVRCHWTISDMYTLVGSAAGLEHFRSSATASGRLRRPSTGANRPWAVLERMWTKATEVVAGSTAQGFDETFPARSIEVTRQVAHWWQAVQASPGRWITGGGPSDKRVLVAILGLCLDAVSLSVEADLRRLAVMVGVSRETVRRALSRLARDGWISRVSHGTGIHADRWTIPSDRVIPTSDDPGVSQVNTPPDRRRLSLSRELRDWLTAVAHDAFTPSGLGLAAGNVWGDLAWIQAYGGKLLWCEGLDQVIGRLEQHGLVHRGLHHPSQQQVNLDLVASRLKTDGVLQRRAARYAVERRVWAWWRAELDRLRHPVRNTRFKRVRDDGVVYPRIGGKPDHRLAAALIWNESPDTPSPSFTHRDDRRSIKNSVLHKGRIGHG